VRPLTRSGPRATRTSHTPGRRSRSEPAPRVHVMAQARGRRLPQNDVDQCPGSGESLVGIVVGMRSWTSGIELGRFHYPATISEGAPEGIRTPNLLIRSQMLYPLSYGRVAIRPRQLYKTAAEGLESAASAGTVVRQHPRERYAGLPRSMGGAIPDRSRLVSPTPRFGDRGVTVRPSRENGDRASGSRTPASGEDGHPDRVTDSTSTGTPEGDRTADDRRSA
jgi:hypothetical protein